MVQRRQRAAKERERKGGAAAAPNVLRHIPGVPKSAKGQQAMLMARFMQGEKVRGGAHAHNSGGGISGVGCHSSQEEGRDMLDAAAHSL